MQRTSTRPDVRGGRAQILIAQSRDAPTARESCAPGPRATLIRRPRRARPKRGQAQARRSVRQRDVRCIGFCTEDPGRHGVRLLAFCLRVRACLGCLRARRRATRAECGMSGVRTVYVREAGHAGPRGRGKLGGRRERTHPLDEWVVRAPYGSCASLRTNAAAASESYGREACLTARVRTAGAVPSWLRAGGGQAHVSPAEWAMSACASQRK